jgi:small subunit ribosomal protein S3
MGQKVNPRSMRLQVDHDWQSRWYADRDYAVFLIQDLKIRRAIAGKLSKRAGVARVDIERSPGQIVVTIHTSKPGVVIGRGGSGAEELKILLAKTRGRPGEGLDRRGKEARNQRQPWSPKTSPASSSAALASAAP